MFLIQLGVLDYPTFSGTNGALLTKPTQRDGDLNTPLQQWRCVYVARGLSRDRFEKVLVIIESNCPGV